MPRDAVNSSVVRPSESRDFVHMRNGWWKLVLLLLALCVLPAQAQYRASLQGTVADSQGAMVPGAQLTLTDTGNQSRTDRDE